MSSLIRDTALTPAQYHALPKARGRHKRTPGMNRLELAYSQQLELRKAAGEVLWWGYECIKFKLAPATFYTPDFMVMLADGEMQMHETKGSFFEDDARVKVKVVAEMFPFKFEVVRYSKVAGWTFEEVGA